MRKTCSVEILCRNLRTSTHQPITNADISHSAKEEKIQCMKLK